MILDESSEGSRQIAVAALVEVRANVEEGRETRRDSSRNLSIEDSDRNEVVHRHRLGREPLDQVSAISKEGREPRLSGGNLARRGKLLDLSDDVIELGAQATLGFKPALPGEGPGVVRAEQVGNVARDPLEIHDLVEEAGEILLLNRRGKHSAVALLGECFSLGWAYTQNQGCP